MDLGRRGAAARPLGPSPGAARGPGAGDRGWGGQLRALGDQEVGGHGDIRCGVEGQSLADVVPFIDALENLRVGFAGGRPVDECVKDFLAALRFPCLKILGAALEKRQALACTLLFLFYEGMKVAQS